MRIGIFNTTLDACDAAAQFIINNFPKGGNLGVATGSTPLPLYLRLRAAYNRGEFDLSDAQAFALDEYVEIGSEDPQRYRNVLRYELVGDDKTGLSEDALHTPLANGGDPEQAAAAYEKDIADAGGIDLQILGLGANGHIGFNEPGEPFTSRTHSGALTEQTRADNARFFGDEPGSVPTHCVTQGLGTIMDARVIVLLATGPAKAEAVHALVEGEVSENCPASILQKHPNVVLFLNNNAAAKLENKAEYNQAWREDAK